MQKISKADIFLFFFTLALIALFAYATTPQPMLKPNAEREPTYKDSLREFAKDMTALIAGHEGAPPRNGVGDAVIGGGQPCSPPENDHQDRKASHTQKNTCVQTPDNPQPSQ